MLSGGRGSDSRGTDPSPWDPAARVQARGLSGLQVGLGQGKTSGPDPQIPLQLLALKAQCSDLGCLERWGFQGRITLLTSHHLRFIPLCPVTSWCLGATVTLQARGFKCSVKAEHRLQENIPWKEP